MSQQFFSIVQTTLNAGFTKVGLLTSVVVLACILGAEIACICILISKMLRARRARQERGMGDKLSNDSPHRFYGMLFFMGAIPQVTYAALEVLAVLTVVGALLFAVLLIIFLAKGYDCAPAAWVRAQEKRQSEERRVRSARPARPVEEPEPAPEETAVFVTLEEERAPVEEETPEEELLSEVPGDDQPIYADLSAPVATQEPASVREPVFADGSQPYKVVERVVTETYKEIVKETPVPVVQPSGDTAEREEVMEKLSDFLDFELQKRKEQSLEDSVEDEDDLPLELEDAEDADDDVEEDTDEEASADAEESEDDAAETDDDRFTGNERILGFDEETGCYIVAHYRKSFEAKLIQARPNIKKYYSDIKNALLAYKGTKDRVSWNMDSFHNGRTPIAKINVKTRILELYLALDPASLEGTVYRGKDVGDKKKYTDTPFCYKLRTPRKFRWALELVQRTCEEHGLSPIDIEPVDYAALYPFDTTEHLVERKLIKEYIRQEKPATTFELAADHVPDVPEEDGSVIPANANFSWELDNDAPRKEEPAPVDPLPEEENADAETAETTETPAEESVAAMAVEAPVARETVRETVKVTEVRYTERYYSDAEPSYERIVKTEEPVAEAEVIEADEPIEAMAQEDVAAVSSTEEDPFEAYRDPIEDAENDPDAIHAIFDSPQAEENALDAVFGASQINLAEDEEVLASEDESVEENEEFYAEDAPVEESEELYAEDVTAEESEELYAEDAPVEESEELYAEDEPVEESEEFYAEDAPVEESEELYSEDASAEEIEVAEPTYRGVVVGEVVPDEEPQQELQSPPELPFEERPRIRIKPDPTVAIVDISSVQYDFSERDTVNLATLRELGLIQSTARRLKVYTTGPVQKPLNVEADHLTLDAIRAISEADGTIAITQ